MSENVKDYTLSIFNIYLDLDQNTTGIYNTLHDSAVIVDDKLIRRLNEKKGQIKYEILKPLLDNRFIFPANFDERKYFTYYINKLKYSPRHATFIISLTSDCNLCCEYCFEGQQKTAKYMSPEVASRAIQFISNSFKTNPNLEDIHVSFFGGEPLLNRKIMSIICENISYNSDIKDYVRYTLTTNLTTLTDDDIEIFKEYDFLNVEVALDGAKAQHDNRRKFASGKGSFDIVINNLTKLLINNIRVIIILNFDEANEKSYDDLIPFIKSHLPYEKIEFILNPIMKSLCNICDINYMNQHQEMEIFLSIYGKLKEAGLRVQAFGQSDMLCILNKDTSCIIDPEGFIYKCGLMLGKSQYCTGSIFDDIHYSFNYEMIASEAWKPCLEEGCAYLPICGSGCRSLALIHKGDLNAVYCLKKEYFEKVHEVILRDHFEQLMSGGK